MVEVDREVARSELELLVQSGGDGVDGNCGPRASDAGNHGTTQSILRLLDLDGA
jgi:hypothetical protein